MNKIIIRGAREHNLKNIDLDLPRDKFIVFTGVSGSGKSTLAMDTIFAEGQRRYLESLSSYARQFLGQMQKPDVDHIEGLSPTIAIDQKSASHNPRSTVGTVTEIYDYMRLLFARVGTPYCVRCGRLITKLTIEEMVDRVFELPEGTEIQIFAPVVQKRKGEYRELFQMFLNRGFIKARVDGEMIELKKILSAGRQAPALERYKMHTIEILTDELKVTQENISRIFESIESAVKMADGIAVISPAEKNKIRKIKDETKNREMVFNSKLACSHCDVSFPDLEPRLFSFNSPFGACPECAGLGEKKEIDINLIMPDKDKTIFEGGFLPWSFTPNNYYGAVMKAVCETYDIPINARLKDIPEEKIDLIINGPETAEDLKIKYFFHGRSRVFYTEFKGLINHLRDRYARTESESVREEIEKYMAIYPCPVCRGARLKPDALSVKIGEKNIDEISSQSIYLTRHFFDEVKLTSRQAIIARDIIKEIKNRLKFLDDVGLGYLTLTRAAMTLAGGEAQRIRLASQLGSALVGVLYILDEPSVGLHARDHYKLLGTLKRLRDIGNTVIVIEHDEETIREADWIVDIGPRAGEQGGKVVAQGSFNDVLRSKESLTAQYLSGAKSISVPETRRKTGKHFLTITGAQENNLKNVKVEIPLGVFTLVTGVSGSGKSTLINDILYRALARKFYRAMERPGKFKELKGDNYLDKVIVIDQSPIGRTPRSNPATYTGVFTGIRELFASVKESKVRGYEPGRFSFNVAGGRCEACKGEGYNKIEMQFLPDVYIACDICKGKRYGRETLEIKYKGKNISEVLALSIDEALEFFRDIYQIKDTLQVISDVGLGYIRLGQSATTLSGGEAQRVKLASELAKRATGKTLYILDEPTTGLHFDDIKKLLNVLHRLVDAGNSVIVIEHNLDVIKQADWIIDMGPEGGEKGGRVIAQGPPEEIVKYKESYTGQFLKAALKKVHPVK